MNFKNLAGLASSNSHRKVLQRAGSGRINPVETPPVSAPESPIQSAIVSDPSDELDELNATPCPIKKIKLDDEDEDGDLFPEEKSDCVDSSPVSVNGMNGMVNDSAGLEESIEPLEFSDEMEFISEETLNHDVSEPKEMEHSNQETNDETLGEITHVSDGANGDKWIQVQTLMDKIKANLAECPILFKKHNETLIQFKKDVDVAHLQIKAKRDGLLEEEKRVLDRFNAN